MKKYDPFWSKLNNLLGLLRGSEVVKLVTDHYVGQFGNDAPGKLLNGYIEDIQKLLDEAPEENLTEIVTEEKHKSGLPYGGGLRQLAGDLGNLKYDALAWFLQQLATKLKEDARADAGRGREKLAGELQTAGDYVSQAAERINNAWAICKPHMEKGDK
jgi:hypothetical protein